MEIQLTYQAPVYVTVDTEDGRVTSVVVGDEMLTQDREATRDANYNIATRDIAQAFHVAEQATWPGWDFGF